MSSGDHKNSKGISRRDFLIGSTLAGSSLLLSCNRDILTNGLPFSSKPRSPGGALLGPDERTGHRLRDGLFPPPSREMHIPIVIAGAGIAGLSCAWWLQRHGITDFRILELEQAAGGNARSGSNSTSAFPWGAHYLPLPGPEARYVRILLAELGVLQGDIDSPSPAYDDTMLVHAPDERLFIHGQWHAGLLPLSGIGASALKEFETFEHLVKEWTWRRGNDGRYAFTIPSDLSSKDPAFAALDRITFDAWLRGNNLYSEPLHWYIGYCCRDDFGADHRRISAWAGLHYFCSRRGQAANADPHSVLTSAQGNGWIVEKLAYMLEKQLDTEHCVIRMEPGKNRISTDVYNSATEEVVRIHCEHLVWAAPLFLLPRIWPGLGHLDIPEYAPWLVANLTVKNVDESEFTTWDNVIYQGKGLGYVDATHQNLQFHRPDRVLTYYHALSALPPRDARMQLLTTSHETWSREIFADLHKAHPKLEQHCSAIDIWRWPHAMAIPAPGFLASLPARQQSFHSRLFIAHSDLSGFSLFEEAQYWGVKAAEQLLQHHGIGQPSEE